MRSSKHFLIAVALTGAVSMTAMAARIDFNDPRRALGREDNIRVDAELAQDTVSPNGPITLTYRIENLSKSTIAIADKVTDISFDRDSQTVTVSIGSEIPPRTMPHLTFINPGEKRTLAAGGVLHVMIPTGNVRGFPVPRQVQIKVTVLKDLTPFAKLIAQQGKTPSPLPLPDDVFDRWVDNSTSIFLNTLPVFWDNGRPTLGSAESGFPSN